MRRFLNVVGVALAALVFSAQMAAAQLVTAPAFKTTGGAVQSSAGIICLNLDGSYAGCGSGTVSTAPFLSDGDPNVLTLVANTSARLAMAGAGTTAIINVATGTAQCKFGNGSVVATSASANFAAGSTQVRNTAGALDIACISTVANSISIETGTGSPTGFVTADFSAASQVGGVTASGATVTEPPLAEGCRAATTAPTAVTDGQKVNALCGAEGKRVVLPYAIKELAVRGNASATTTAATTIIASAGGSLKNYVTDLYCWNTSATTITMTFSDSASSVFIVPAGFGFTKAFQVPLATAAATAFTFTESTGVTTAGCNAQGFTGL